MNYKIGDKVETPLGVGVITYIDSDGEIDYDYWISIKETPPISFDKKYIQSYKSAHDKLLELGFVKTESGSYEKKIISDTFIENTYTIKIDRKDKRIKTSYYYYNNFESRGSYDAMWLDELLLKILTQYAKELENDKA